MEWVLAGMGFIIGIYLLPIIVGIVVVVMASIFSMFSNK
jgi:hypothetical protein